MAKEEASLIDPYLEDPERYLAWEVDDAAGEVSAIPRSNTAKVKRVATACIETFGLNREELRQLRYETLEGLDSAREALSLPGLPAAKRAKLIARLQRSAAGARPFAAMTRYFLFDVWKIL